METVTIPKLNLVTLIGRTTNAVEVKTTPKGAHVCSFDLAVNHDYLNAAGKWESVASYIPVVVWGDKAKRCGEKIKKGMPLCVEGRLQSTQWETKEGKKRKTVEIVASRVQFLNKSSKDAAQGNEDGNSVDTEA